MWVLGILVECMDDNPESNLQIRVEHLYLYSMVMGGLMADVFIRVETYPKNTALVSSGMERYQKISRAGGHSFGKRKIRMLR